MKKVFTLDFKNWVSGSDKTKFGDGGSQMQNEKNYMCCLGQFSCQLDPKANLALGGTPEDIEYTIPLAENPFVKKVDNSYRDSSDTNLSRDCVSINDSYQLNTLERAKRITKRMEKEGFKVKIVNDKLFNAAGQFIGKHLIKNEWVYDEGLLTGKELAEFVNGNTSVKKFLKVKSCPFTRQLIKKVGSEKARELIKKHLPELL